MGTDIVGRGKAFPGRPVADAHADIGSGDLAEKGSEDGIELPHELRAAGLQGKAQHGELGIVDVQKVVPLLLQTQVARFQHQPVVAQGIEEREIGEDEGLVEKAAFVFRCAAHELHVLLDETDAEAVQKSQDNICITYITVPIYHICIEVGLFYSRRCLVISSVPCMNG